MESKNRHIAFLSTMAAVPWGGSEVLWSNAGIRLLKDNFTVSASVPKWKPRPAQIKLLSKAGIRIMERNLTASDNVPQAFKKPLSFLARSWSLRCFRKELEKNKPALICISSGSIADDWRTIDICVNSKIPYVILLQSNAEHLWPDDQRANRLIPTFLNARRVFFVAHRNKTLLENQLGCVLQNSEVISNPFNVSWNANPPWPTETRTFSLACVARLDPPAKGQDLVLQVLATDLWRSRPLEVWFYGTGPMEANIRRLVDLLGLSDRVKFGGHENNIEQLWSRHHALILASRFEGLPLAIEEAMICGRPVIVTDVAGNADLVVHGVTGFVAEAPTVNHLQKAMESAWERRNDWRSIGEAASASIRKRLPSDPSADFAERLIREWDLLS